MIELLYATGLRVSELVNLKLNNINFDQEYLKTMGKGSKEREIPLGEYSIYYLELYLEKRESMFNRGMAKGIVSRSLPILSRNVEA